MVFAWTLALSAQAAGQCQTFSDPGSFEAFNEKELGWQRLGVEDFEPPVSNLGAGDYAFLLDPLEGGILATGLVTIRSNAGEPEERLVEPGSGLAAVGPGFLDPGLPSPGSVMVGADFFDESTDLVFPDEAALSGVGLTLEVAFGGSVEVSVFAIDDVEILTETVAAPEGESVFFGVSCAEEIIVRINIGGSGGELADDIQMWSAPSGECPWDCGDGDGMVGVVDFLALLAQWGEPGSCDFDGDGVGVTDFLAMLAQWGPCPGE
jgi:hypothetical protein